MSVFLNKSIFSYHEWDDPDVFLQVLYSLQVETSYKDTALVVASVGGLTCEERSY